MHAAIGKLEAPEIGMKSWKVDNDGRGNAKTGMQTVILSVDASWTTNIVGRYSDGFASVHEVG